MGSVPSTPTNERSNDPWWNIENQNLDLNPTASETDSTIMETTRNPVKVVKAESETHSPNSGDNNQSGEIANVSETVQTSNDDSDNVASTSNQREEESTNASAEDRSHRQTLEEFKEELRLKREKRKCAIAELRNEILSLRKQLENEKMLNKKLMTPTDDTSVNHAENFDSDAIAIQSGQPDANITLRTQLSETQFELQKANTENLMLSSELAATIRKTQSLKDIIAALKEIIAVRETELAQLKLKFKEIEDSLADREVHLMSANLRQEYDRQFANMRHLKALYEERARVSAAEKENLTRQLETSDSKLNDEIQKNKNMEEHLASVDAEMKTTTIDLYATREKLSYYKGEYQKLGDEMTVINQLFSQLLTGFNGSNDIDIDSLTSMLEENRDLLNDMTSREHCKEGAAQIPKLLLDLFAQANNPSKPSDEEGETSQSANSAVSSAQEISHNLPKVWKVLIELLNHQQLKPVQIKANDENADTDCYNSVETPAGPKMVLSVSKTYLRLKDLILEKKFLQKETKKLKNLNSHLENRLGEQETRLTAVTIELNKTWTLVGRMQRQHRQLHTSEQVLRYQLQQKRRMLSELKDELEYCRRKWALAKEKNTETQSQWESLRMEFIKRKECDANNSAESGYSDTPLTDDDDEVPSDSLMHDKRREMKGGDNDRKIYRIQSLSPVRRTTIHAARRNSEPHIAQFATEIFQLRTDVVQAINDTCPGCDENCAINSVHFDDCPKNDQIKITETIVHEASETTTQPAALKSNSKKGRKGGKKASGKKNEESLEEMFMRIAGIQPEEPPCEDSEDDSDDSIEEDVEIETVEASIPIAPNFDDPQPSTSAYGNTGAFETASSDPSSVSASASTSALPASSILTQSSTSIPVTASSSNEMDSIEPQPSTSEEQPAFHDVTARLSAIEKAYTERRSERLKRLEDESSAFLEKMRKNNDRASQMQNKLKMLHERYGSEKKSIEPNAEECENTEENTEAKSEEAAEPTEDAQTKSDEAEERTEDAQTKSDEAEERTENSQAELEVGEECAEETKQEAKNEESEERPENTKADEGDEECVKSVQASQSEESEASDDSDQQEKGSQ